MSLYPRSEEHHRTACRHLAGGVGSNARLTPGLHPLCFERGAGSRIFDIDGNEYIDYVLAIGSLILGHCPEPVAQAVKKQLDSGSMFGAAAVGEDVLARLLCERMPSVDLLSFTNSASEAVHMALRLARAFTGKTKYLKFEGCYHGWIDDEMVSVHSTPSGVNTIDHDPQPILEGPGQIMRADDVCVAPFNSLEGVERVLQRKGHEIAALIVEPIPCTNGVIPPEPGFLQGLRDLSDKYECLLIFDETVTGFRLVSGSAQAFYGVRPDLTVLGKAIGGGYPIAAFGGSNEVMELIANQKVGRAGTYNSNSLCVAAATAVVTEVFKDDGAALKRLTSLGQALMKGLEQLFAERGLPVTIQGPGGLFSAFFTDRPVRDYRDTFRTNEALFRRYWLGLTARGVRLWATTRSVWFVSAAHAQEDVDLTLEKVSDTLHEVTSKATH